jgi:type VI secretion system protein ImpH
MAGKNRRSSSNLKEDGDTDVKQDLKSDLLAHGGAFSFFQVMRLLRLFQRNGGKALNADYAQKASIRVRPKLSLAFPPADVDRVEEKRGEKDSFFQVTANFLGLYGTSSPLPTFYTEDLLDEASEDQSVSREFVDIVNHRIYELLYGCLTKYRQSIQVVEEGNKDHIQRLFSLVGLGEKTLRENIPDSHILLRYIGLFTQFPRSASGLKTLLQDILGEIPVEFIPCISRKVKIPEDQRTCLGVCGGKLGVDNFLGEEIEDRSGKFRLRIGPMDKKNFQSCSPNGDKHKNIVHLTSLYMVEPLEYDMELIMDRGQKETVCLGDPEWAALGVNTWIFSGRDEWESRSIVHPDN